MLERILYVLKEKNLSCNFVERSLGFGNGAIKRFDKNSPSIDKIIALSNFLNISIEWLVEGKGEIYKNDKDNDVKNNNLIELSPIEKNFIKIYRELDDDTQSKFIDYIYELKNTSKNKSKGKLLISKTTYNNEVTSTSETGIA